MTCERKCPDPTLRSRADAEHAFETFRILVTGLRSGETITGTGSVSQGALLSYRAPDGVHPDTVLIPPREKELDWIRLEPDLWELFIEKLGCIEFFSEMPHSQREVWLETFEAKKDVDISEMGGEIEVLQLGKSDLVNKLSADQVESIIEAGSISASDVRVMIPGKPGTNAKRHTLFFLRWFWQLSTAGASVSSSDLPVVDVNTGEVFPHGVGTNKSTIIHVFESNGVNFGIRVNRRGVNLAIPELTEIARFVLGTYGLESTLDDDVEMMIRATSGFTAAGFKSLIQKIVRFRPKTVKIPRGSSTEFEEVTLVAEVALVVSFVLLFANPGSFVPTIQRFVSGAESAAKRLVVTIYEDSCFDTNEMTTSLFQLTIGAFLFQRSKNYKPSNEFVAMCFDMAIQAIREPKTIGYTDTSSLNLFTMATVIPDNSVSSKLEYISVFMDELKSFAGDLAMMRWCAHNQSSARWAWKPVTAERPQFMPLEHCIDQHWTPEIGLFYPSAMVKTLAATSETRSKPFAPLFVKLFVEITGYNPRKSEWKTSFDDPSTDKFMEASRLAQRMVYTARTSTDTYTPEFSADVAYEYELDRSWISGMTGPIVIKGRPTGLVTLHPHDPEVLVAIRNPSRDIKCEADALLTDERESVVIETAKDFLRQGYPMVAASPPIPELKNKELVLDDSRDPTYYIRDAKGRDVLWESLRMVNSFTLGLAYAEPRLLCDIVCCINSANAIFEDWEIALEELVARSDHVDVQRAIVYLKGFDPWFEFNRISRDGGGTKYAVVQEDVGAYQFILHLTDIIPGALTRKSKSPLKFTVQNGPLMWSIRDKLEEIVLGGRPVAHGNKWGDIHDTKKRTMKAHQTDIVASMSRRHEIGKSNHFIWSTVGSGKTLCVLTYLKYLLERNELPDYVIYTLPGSSTGTIVAECEAMGFDVVILDPLKRKKIPKTLSHFEYRLKGMTPVKFKITMIEHDHLRYCEDVLPSIAPKCMFIIDEVHKALNETKRTSVALAISRLSHEVVALTGTPIIDTHTYKLIWWLKQITEFDVNEKNFWVAANGMIAKKYSPNVDIARVEIRADLTKAESKLYFSLVPPAMGGKNTNAGPKSFNKSMVVCYDACTRTMADETVNLLSKHAPGPSGVFLVAHNTTHAEELTRLLVEKGVRGKDIFTMAGGASIHLTDEAVESRQVPDYKVVITTIRKSEGYTLTRLKSMVTCVYPSNNATREQIEGRIVRIGQSAEVVDFVTVHAGILTYIMRRHADARNLAAVLKKLADEIV